MPDRGSRGPGPAAVLWDMDGTLVDSEKLWTVSLGETAHWLGGELSTPAREAMVGAELEQSVALLFEDLGLEPAPEPMAAAARYLTDRTAALFAAGLPWRPGAQEALAMVDELGWPSALVTNTARTLTDSALASIGRAHFTVTVCSDEVAHGKPDPDLYLRAAELLGLDATRCVAVEDSRNGARSARRAGAAVLVVPCDVPVLPEPGWVLRSTLVGLTVDDLRACYDEVRGHHVA